MSLKRRYVGLVALALGATGILGSSAMAQGVPHPPDFTTVFGTVQDNGGNIAPTDQPVIAFVNGRSCGNTETMVAPDEPGNEGDAGKTVYAVDVMADGSGLFQKAGCGQAGQLISFYFPALGKMANETQQFMGAAFERQDLTTDTALSNQLVVPASANDGVQ